MRTAEPSLNRTAPGMRQAGVDRSHPALDNDAVGGECRAAGAQSGQRFRIENPSRDSAGAAGWAFSSRAVPQIGSHRA
jgi:hypothetical protein